jgi:flavin-dependent dehydrogenase
MKRSRSRGRPAPAATHPQKPKLHDVLIVGAGPAGATAAKILAESGLKALLLDADKPHEKTCAGWVSRLAGEMFPYVERQAGKLADMPFSGLIFHGPDLKQTAEFAERGRSGWVVDRAAFDGGLAKIAEASGAEVLYRKKVVRAAFEEEGVRLFTEDGAEHAGRALLAADGADGMLSRLSGRPGGEKGLGMLAAGASAHVNPRLLEKSFGKNRALRLALAYGGINGYGYVVARKNAVSFGVAGRGLSSADAELKFAAFVRDLAANELLSPEAAAAAKPVIRPLPAGTALESDDQVGKRVLFIGDAGGFASAVVGEGIFPGMWSAKIAAETLIVAFKAPKFQDALMGFKQRWRTEMADHLRMPNTNMAFLLPLIFSNKQMTERFARAVLYGKNI